MDSSQTNSELKGYYQKIKPDIQEDHLEYLTKHPEVQKILSDYLSSLLTHKPTDVHAYSKDFFNFLNKTADPNNFHPLIICGPSGVGKGTLVKYLLETFPNKFSLSISYTTRAPRAGEQHAREYFFVSKEEFQKEIDKNSFLEVCDVHGNFYGTHKSVVQETRDLGRICILDIDVVGAQKIDNTGIESVCLFIMPPSNEVLRQRLVTRKTETEEQVAKRMKTAEFELQCAEEIPLFKNKIVNDDLDTTKKELIAFLNEKYPGLNLQA